MGDPLYVLRDHVINKKPVHTEGNDIVFQNNVRFPKSTQTIFQNRLTKEHFTLEALFFAYQHADSAPSAYISACNKAGLKFVSLVDNKDLQAFLRGQLDSSPSIDVSAIAPTPAPVPQPVDEERQAKRQKTEKLQDIELDDTLLEEKKQNIERLEATQPKASFVSFGGNTASAALEGMSKDAIEMIKLKRMQRKNAIISVEENLTKKQPVKGGFVKADAVITKKIVDREKLLSNRSSILNTNGKKNFTDIINAVTKSAKKEEEAKLKLRDKNQKATSQTYDRYNVKEDQNWWKDKLKTNLEDFEIDTRGTFADGGITLDKAPPSSSSETPSAPPRPSSRAPLPSSSKPTKPPSSSSSTKLSHPSTKPPAPSSGLPSGPPPIIIVPSALTSLITMYNAFDFLEHGQYVNSMQRRGETSTKASSVIVTHTPKTKGLPDKFQIVDSTTRMGPKDWSRVVAVFVLGQAWQFKDWQWSSPAELFSNVKGFYLRCDDTQAPPEVKSWNVKILTISKTKRHLDKTAALDFWNSLEDFLARKVKH
eukprot:Phypoly_transcript_02582.p1 GENE.Phypoly_transcript_02582~~Phypoly_transcript_02582.p1  ORF type:complete len:537 (-),score=134.79 Phypoly_transcript_02582:289-1899(-)